ncbi:MAG: 4-(cytidine 5'-diphospho)-2-C-methyl-D-erythritol kinase [Planctomycetaceae bacterium]
MVVRPQGRLQPWVSLTGRLGGNHPADGTQERDSARAASLVVHAPAKLNLSLRVLGRRPDGFHELETVMVSVGLFDSLHVTAADSEEVRLTCCCAGLARRTQSALGRELTSGADNLVVRAAELLRQRTGCQRGATITLIKRIPLQAGLGGGSSDAAAALVALNQIWDLGLSTPELHTLAAALGSDVNFFLDSPTAAICRGRGELVEPIRLHRRLHAVVVCPNSGLSTADVFREWSRSSAGPDQRRRSLSCVLDALPRGRQFAHDSPWIGNDLEIPARRLNPDVAETLVLLHTVSSGPVGMSGSGTSCFTLCPSATRARRLACRLRTNLGSHVFPVSSRA